MQNYVNTVLGIIPQQSELTVSTMKNLRTSILSTLALASLVAVSLSSAGANTVAGRSVAIEDADTLRVERLFSNGGGAAVSAPKIWSSRLEIRWQARWEAAPRYAV